MRAIYGALIVFIIMFFSLFAIIYYGTADTVTFTVQEKERITESSGEGTSSKYLIFTDKGVFENTDSWVFWKFNSSDLYGKLKAGKTYQCKVAGWRINFLSWYKNIITVKEVQLKKETRNVTHILQLNSCIYSVYFIT